MCNILSRVNPSKSVEAEAEILLVVITSVAAECVTTRAGTTRSTNGRAIRVRDTSSAIDGITTIRIAGIASERATTIPFSAGRIPRACITTRTTEG